MNNGKLIVFSAPSGSGKTTIVRYLLAQKELHLDFSISATSREKRGEEIDGRDYYFLSAEEFQKKIEENAFVEYEEVYKDNYYGTLKSELERIWAAGKHVIFDIDVIGGLNIKKQYPKQTLAVFVSPPSVEELERRLRFRQTETDEKIQMRLAKAEKEIAKAEEFDVILKNYDLEIAKNDAYKLVYDYLKMI
ncbi:MULTISPECIES: guanylate kinase [Flavobacterium]|jgi:guanylate kinase|uniref:Guanylate kinase n=1 Tax=Flavobacterium lindanitolerans TaxID=428988 RepID=A0A497V429_9FLAO|nr:MULTISPECIES: guanylate kinase [Flavobacterium]PZO32196.1 MAG: guanylate kinase [Flavobacteriaceae bacterium]PZQ83892.1 MAG: guanylate kinase [Flavobacterium johnsoniae]KQS52615.1 guanylate kinase [Flavobacterium sp. Leaf359]MBL7867593.1 guanylate kinase [Flavobacterium lindanitolerans]MDQ7959460.1 guanylate kinase [Flavobacterium lindanitolerans]